MMGKRTSEDELSDDTELSRGFSETHDDDYDVNFVTAPQPTYSISVVKNKLVLKKDSELLREIEKSELRPEFAGLTYEIISQMMSVFRKSGEATFVERFCVNEKGKG